MLVVTGDLRCFCIPGLEQPRERWLGQTRLAKVSSSLASSSCPYTWHCRSGALTRAFEHVIKAAKRLCDAFLDWPGSENEGRGGASGRKALRDDRERLPYGFRDPFEYGTQEVSSAKSRRGCCRSCSGLPCMMCYGEDLITWHTGGGKAGVP